MGVHYVLGQHFPLLSNWLLDCFFSPSNEENLFILINALELRVPMENGGEGGALPSKVMDELGHTIF